MVKMARAVHPEEGTGREEETWHKAKQLFGELHPENFGGMMRSSLSLSCSAGFGFRLQHAGTDTNTNTNFEASNSRYKTST